MKPTSKIHKIKTMPMGWLIAILPLFLYSCEQFLEIDPPATALTSNTVFSDDATANAALLGIYENMAHEGNGFTSGIASITLLTGLSSDEFLNYSTNANQAQFFNNELQPTNSLLQVLWTDLFNHIYTTNAILEGLEKGEGITPSVKSQLISEAKFVRAFCYFYLVNTFGQVPLLTATDYTINSLAPRSSEENVYEQIIADLKDAEAGLPSSYETTEQIRPSQLAATAMLARTYLFTGDWTSAETAATKVITSPFYKIESDITKVFLKESTEAIWQIQPVLSQLGVFDAYYLIITSTPRRAALSHALIGEFEEGDLRKENWVGSRTVNTETYYYPFKYKQSYTASPTTPPDEYLIGLRLAEQFLIRAEARAQLGDIAGAQEDLNIIRSRADLPNTTASDSESLLSSIEQENRTEFFAEWGHRWLDLKRTNRIDATLQPQKPASWQPYDAIYPVPQNEIKLNTNLLPQNDGY